MCDKRGSVLGKICVTSFMNAPKLFIQVPEEREATARTARTPTMGHIQKTATPKMEGTVCIQF